MAYLELKRKTNFHLLIAFCFFLSVFAAGCFNDNSSSVISEVKKYDAAALAGVEKIIADTAPAGGPCALAGIWNEGYETLLIAKGKADVAAGRDSKPTDRFRIASNTKMFTAVGLLMLADLKKIDLNEKLSKYLPEIPHASEVTIRQIANHTAGYCNYTKAAEFIAILKGNIDKVWTAQEIMDTVKNKPLDFTPGTKYSYSNTGYIIMGLLIEKLSGIKWEDYIKQKILFPLAMNDTYPSADIEIAGEHVNAYMYEGTVPVEIKFGPTSTWAAGCLVSTITDLKKWLDAIQRGVLLSPEMQAEHRKWVAAENGNSYGFGLEFVRSKFIGHTGSYPGYNSFVFISTDGKKALVLVHYVDGIDASQTAGKIIDYLGL